VGADPAALVVPHQVHGASVAVVGAADRGRTIAATDGLATAAPGVPLLVQGADCPLVLVADDAAGAVAVVHSGWRGTVRRISAEGVRAVVSLGARPERAVAAIFPGIGPCCFEVGPDVVAEFEAAFGRMSSAWLRPGAGDRSYLDLAAAIRRTLADAGLSDGNVETVPGCTVCGRGASLWSHRGSKGGPERHGLLAVVRDMR
jgi:YfiH family protein